MSTLSLINRVKYSRRIYTLYYYIGSIAINVLKLFVRTENDLIVFSSFGGRKYDDSPKCIYEAMLCDGRFDGYRLVWAFMKPEDYTLPRGEKVKTDTFAYYKMLLKARCWITNSTMERGLDFKGKRTFYYNSWHGTPIKLMGSDIHKGNKSFASKRRSGCPYDVFLAQSQYDAEIFEQSFRVPHHAMRIIGLPRNDELAHGYDTEKLQDLRCRLGIPQDKKVILYAPTFREYVKDEDSNCALALPVDFAKWRRVLGDEYVLLLRAHYEVVKMMNVDDNGFVYEVSGYHNLNELIQVSDLLISDYSSLFFDYAITGKPMLCFAYDYDEYASKRGMYFDIRNWLLSASDEDGLLELIKVTAVTKMSDATRKFREQFVTEFGSATRKSLDTIYENIT